MMSEKPCPGMRGARSFRTRRAHPSAKLTLRAISGPSPLGHPSWAPPWRGGLRTPAREASAWPRHVPGRPTGLLPHHRVETECLGSRPTRIRGRTECVPPRNRLSRHFRALPRKAILAWMAPAEGRAPHARSGGLASTRGSRHYAHGRSFAPDDYVMPRPASGPYSRTHGVRPSEKTAFRVVPRSSPQGHLPLDRPPHGGAGSARPLGRLCLHRAIAPLGPRAFVCPR